MPEARATPTTTGPSVCCDRPETVTAKPQAPRPPPAPGSSSVASPRPPQRSEDPAADGRAGRRGEGRRLTLTGDRPALLREDRKPAAFRRARGARGRTPSVGEGTADAVRRGGDRSQCRGGGPGLPALSRRTGPRRGDRAHVLPGRPSPPRAVPRPLAVRRASARKVPRTVRRADDRRWRTSRVRRRRAETRRSARLAPCPALEVTVASAESRGFRTFLPHRVSPARTPASATERSAPRGCRGVTGSRAAAAPAGSKPLPPRV